jgi:hypothetical protein
LSDDRPSTYTLAWQGTASPTSRLHDEFENALPDILIGIERQSLQDVEWSLGRLIFLIHRNETKTRRNARIVLVAAIAYAMIIIAIVIVILLLRR